MISHQMNNRVDIDAAKKKLPVSSGEIEIGGKFNAFCTSFSTNTSLLDIPDYYRFIDVSYAVLGEYAILELEWNPLSINIPMIKKVHMEKKIPVILSIGGKNGNFYQLNGADKVTNFFNSLIDIYLDWGFDGINIDLRWWNGQNCLYLIKAIRWFQSTYPEAIISITVDATGVSPLVQKIDGEWNRLVLLINELNNYLDWIQIVIDGYIPAFEQLFNLHQASPPVPPFIVFPLSPPNKGSLNSIPLTNPQIMSEYIVKSYRESFRFSTPIQNEDNIIVEGYNGFPLNKLLMGVLPDSTIAHEYFIPPSDLKQVVHKMRTTSGELPAGLVLLTINDDAKDNFRFSKQLTGYRDE